MSTTNFLREQDALQLVKVPKWMGSPRSELKIIRSASERIYPKRGSKIKFISGRVHPKGWVKIISPQVDGFIVRDESEQNKSISGRAHPKGWVKIISPQVDKFIISDESKEYKSISGRVHPNGWSKNHDVHKRTGSSQWGDWKIIKPTSGQAHPRG